jgi:hypothetical protein
MEGEQDRSFVALFSNFSEHLYHPTVQTALTTPVYFIAQASQAL